MAATSPYSPNDYQAVSNYRPYELPINDIFKGISAQNQFWDAGARRVKSVYDNALNLKLSLEPNREIRKKFMEEAEKQLAKLSSMDLSDPSVQRQGFSIFKPLFQDDGIVSDDQATRWIEDLQGDIQKAREFDNGKGYADSNAIVAMEGVYEFKSAKDRMAGKQYLANKRSYSPYYDPSKEMAEITKNCKGPTYKGTKPGDANDMYMFTEEVSGASPTRLQACLEAGLSPKAKDQIKTDGYAAYMTSNRQDHPEGKNYRALRDDYVIYNKAALDGVSQQIGDLDGKILAFQSLYDKTKDPKYLDAKKAAEEMKGNYKDQYTNLSEAMTQVTAGNLDYIKKNYGQLSQQIYSHKQLGAFANSFNTDSVTNKYSADAVKLQNQRLVYDAEKTRTGRLHDKDMAEIDFQNDMKLEALKGSFKGKKLVNGQLVEEYVPTNPAFTDKDKVSVGYTEFQNERNIIKAGIDGANEELFNRLKEEFPKELGQMSAQDFFKQGPNGISPALSFLDTHGGATVNSQAINRWKVQSSLLSNKLALWNAVEEGNQAEYNTRASKLDDQKATTNIGGYMFTDKEVADAMGGAGTTLQGRTSTRRAKIDKGDGKSEIVDIPYTEFIYNGQVIGSQDGAAEWSPNMKNTIQKIQNVAAGNTKIRNEIYGRSTLAMRPGVYAAANNDDEHDPTRLNIRAALGVDIPLTNIQIIEKDPITGMATISVKADGKIAESTSFLKERLSKLTTVDKSSFTESGNEVVLKMQSPYLVNSDLSNNPLSVLQLTVDKFAQLVLNPQSTFAKVRPGEKVRDIPLVTDKLDANIKIMRTMSGVEYDIQLKGSDGKYHPTGKTATTSNELLEYLHKASQMTK